MKKRFLWVAWILVPVAAAAVHYGPAKPLEARDDAARHIRSAEAAAAAEKWEDAAAEYAAARVALPPTAERTERTRLSIMEAKMRIEGGDFVEGESALENILADEQAAPDGDAALAEQARNELGTVQYLTAWMMRLEGAGADEWKPVAEDSRQNFRLMAESGGSDAEAQKKNVEAVIRLEQMDLTELQALPFPKKCCGNCKGCCQGKRNQRLSQGKGKGKPQDDARKQIKSDSAGMAKERGKGS
jgi:hypothetical protein